MDGTADTTLGDRPGPLAGLLVADFSRVLAGPYCTMILADLGADVIKVEGPGGDDTRHWMPPVRERHLHLLPVHQPQQAVDPLNLRDDGGSRCRRPSSPGGPTSWWRTSSRVACASSGWTTRASGPTNPAVIYASITGFGAGGGAHLPGYDLIVEAMSGLMSLQGDTDGPPYRAGVAIFDVMSGLQTTIGVLAALDHRRRTGEGQLVEVNLMAAALAGMVNQTGAFASAGVVPHRMGNAHPSLFPYEPLPDRRRRPGDRGRQRRPVPQPVRGARRAGARRDERFAANSGRTANRDQLRPLLVERLQGPRRRRTGSTT